MNDAFSILKDMVPACQGGEDEKGKEMHKLDVLNAGIEYLAYLETCLARMNERGWDAMEEDTKEMDEDGGQQEPEQEPEQEQEQEQEQSRLKRETQHSYPYQCHCRCHGRSSNQTEPHARTSLPPSPPPSLEPRPQDYYPRATTTTTTATTTMPTSSYSDHTSTDRDQERDHDAAATASTAAALLMLTSTDRRDRRQISTPTAANRRDISDYRQHYASTGNGTWNHDHGPDEAGRPGPPHTPRLPGKAGLSVRDLLSNV
jgi:Helix-loop-helix DNA-binding domain